MDTNQQCLYVMLRVGDKKPLQETGERERDIELDGEKEAATTYISKPQ